MTISLNPLRSTSHTLDRAHFPDSVISADFAQCYRRRAWCFALNAGKFRRQTPDRSSAAIDVGRTTA